MISFLGAAMIVCAGCPREPHGRKPRTGTYPHNLSHLYCDGRKGEPYQINLVPSGQVLYDLSDTVVFVCEGDTLNWSIPDRSLSIKVTFTDGYAGDLFEHGETSIGSTSGVTEGKQIKSPKGHEWRLYKYSIEIFNGNTSVGKIDPHVIPMGN